MIRLLSHSYKVLWFLGFLLLFEHTVCAQGPTSYWHFGDSAVLHFQNYVPQPLAGNSSLFSRYSSSSISDPNGNLDYYANTTGCFVSNNDSLPNGNEILGLAGVGRQSSLLIPNFVYPQKHYLFTLWESAFVATSQTGGYFHHLKRNGVNPLGYMDEESQNIHFFDYFQTLRLAAVHHGNGKDVWLILRKTETDTMLSYLVDETGLVATPVISKVSVSPNNGSVIAPQYGQLKASPNGEFLVEPKEAATLDSNQSAWLHKFDRFTGKISSTLILPAINLTNGAGAWGAADCIEFSQNSEKLYLAKYASSASGFQGGIAQFDLSVDDSAAIVASKEIINPGMIGIRHLQLAVDGKIYGIEHAPLQSTTDKLFCIENPDDEASNVVLNSNAVVFPDSIVLFGLPAFIQSIFHPAYFEVVDRCSGRPLQFLSYNSKADSVHWYFGDSTSLDNESSLFNPVHEYGKAGIYNVVNVTYWKGRVDTFMRELWVFGPSLDNVAGDYVLCEGEELVLDMTQNDTSVKWIWQDSSTATIRKVTESDTLWVSAWNNCDTIVDTVRVSFDKPLLLNLKDTVFCAGDTIKVNLKLNTNVIYSWSNGSDSSSFLAYQPDTISVTLLNACDTLMDTLILNEVKSPSLPTVSDTATCESALELSFEPLPFITYHLVNDQVDTLDGFNIDKSGAYQIVAENECGIASDSFQFVVKRMPEIESHLLDDLCPDDSVMMVIDHSVGNLFINGSAAFDSIWIKEQGEYLIQVIDTPCVTEYVEFIGFDDCSEKCEPIVPNVITPNGDGLNDYFHPYTPCEVIELSFQVINRWGQLLFEGSEVSSVWDGTIANDQASDGAYFYIVHITYRSGSQIVDQTFKGSFSIFK